MGEIISLKIPYTFIGLGAISRLGEMVKLFSPTRGLIVTDAGVSRAGILDSVKSCLEKAECRFDIYDSCGSEPAIAEIEELGKKVKAGQYDLLIGVGGGSVMDATKIASIIAVSEMSVYDLIKGGVAQKALSKILIPTTAGSGSEWSSVAVVSDDRAGRQTKVVRGDKNLADAVIVDPELTLTLPQSITADTGMDALTHGIEAYTSARANVISDMLAETAIRLIAGNLRMAYAKGNKNTGARYNMSVAASLAMHALVVAGAGLVHYMNEPLGKKARIPHGKACALLLPHVMNFNLIANPEKFARIADMMGEKTAQLSLLDAAAKSVEAIKRLSRDLGMPERMRDVGIGEKDIPAMVEEVLTFKGPLIIENNCRNADRETISALFTLAL